MPIDFAAVTKARLAVIATNATLRNAAVAPSSPHIGLVIICEENETVAGVVSKSDLVRHLMLDQTRPSRFR
jgi:CBS domain-containing protein